MKNAAPRLGHALSLSLPGLTRQSIFFRKILF
jgi:hypothetical protein